MQWVTLRLNSLYQIVGCLCQIRLHAMKIGCPVTCLYSFENSCIVLLSVRSMCSVLNCCDNYYIPK